LCGRHGGIGSPGRLLHGAASELPSSGVGFDCRPPLSALNVRDEETESDPCLPAYF
jgi:hypothetical protein